MEKKMENDMETLGPSKGVYRDNIPTNSNSRPGSVYLQHSTRSPKPR